MYNVGTHPQRYGLAQQKHMLAELREYRPSLVLVCLGIFRSDTKVY